MNLRGISIVAVVVAVVTGIAMIVLGSIFVGLGATAKSDIAAALRQEDVTTSMDASVPGALVEDVETARAQQDSIEAHTFGRFGPYSSLERDDPNRESYLKGLTLRNSLNLAIVGFGVGDLAMGVGVVTIVLGVMLAGLAIPVHLLVLRVGRLERAKESS